jgi:hypothetical protein
MGEAYGAVFIGWSANLQSGWGVSNNLKAAIANRVHAETAANAVAVPMPTQSAATFVPRGTVVGSKTELAAVLADWLANSRAKTIGDVGSYGGKAWLQLDIDGTKVVLNSDTKRDAVHDYIQHANKVGAEAPWAVVANRKGAVNKVTYTTEKDLRGWYCYVSTPWSSPGEL